MEGCCDDELLEVGELDWPFDGAAVLEVRAWLEEEEEPGGTTTSWTVIGYSVAPLKAARVTVISVPTGTFEGTVTLRESAPLSPAVTTLGSTAVTPSSPSVGFRRKFTRLTIEFRPWGTEINPEDDGKPAEEEVVVEPPPDVRVWNELEEESDTDDVPAGLVVL